MGFLSLRVAGWPMGNQSVVDVRNEVLSAADGLYCMPALGFPYLGRVCGVNAVHTVAARLLSAAGPC